MGAGPRDLRGCSGLRPLKSKSVTTPTRDDLQLAAPARTRLCLCQLMPVSGDACVR